VDPPWSKDYDTSVAEMKLPLLLTSTFTDDSRASVVTNKTCLYVTGCTFTDQSAVDNTCGGRYRYKTCADVQPISRARSVSYTDCQGVEGEGYKGRSYQDTRKRDDQEIVVKWGTTNVI
jgi:hypothetical protein